MINKRPYFLVLCFFVLAVRGQYPADVQASLQKAGSNRAQLKKALDYFYASKDALKIQSINFLVANMPYHSSYSYFWADTLGRRVAFSELDYPTYNSAVMAFDRLKEMHGRLHPVPLVYRDIDSIKADLLIENVALAVDKYRERSGVGFEISTADFFEYVLPYRITVEPLEDWRKVYAERFPALFDGKQDVAVQLEHLKYTITGRFINVYNLEKREEPLPRLGALQILLRGKGYCEDMADMAVFMARSYGIAATVDNIPEWATTSGNHFLNYVELDSTHRHFDAALDSLGREPAKVLRSTFSVQKGNPALWLDTSSIPPGFLRLANFKDVTREYWPTEDLVCPLFPGGVSPIVYVCVLNGGEWKPVWYGSRKDDRVVFKDMGKGVVYLPMLYKSRRWTPAGWPFALGYSSGMLLAPDVRHLRTVNVLEQERYLKYRPGRHYRLYYWNNKWQFIGDKIAPPNCRQLSFDNAPAGALFILIPDYSTGKERPFTISNTGQVSRW